jgi:hypothetical protein
MRRERQAMLMAALATVLMTATTVRAACDAAPGILRGESTGAAVALRTTPSPVRIGELFSLQAEVCGNTGARITGLKVDATMPAHRHGMNYQPVVTRVAADRFNVRGLMFHMPGRWQFVIGVETASGREDIRIDTTVK